MRAFLLSLFSCSVLLAPALVHAAYLDPGNAVITGFPEIPGMGASFGSSASQSSRRGGAASSSSFSRAHIHLVTSGSAASAASASVSSRRTPSDTLHAAAPSAPQSTSLPSSGPETIVLGLTLAVAAGWTIWRARDARGRSA